MISFGGATAFVREDDAEHERRPRAPAPLRVDELEAANARRPDLEADGMGAIPPNSQGVSNAGGRPE